MIPEPVRIYTNADTGMSSYVSKGRNSTFSVTLRDDDSSEIAFFGMDYKTLEAACAKAQEVMGPVFGSVGTVWAPVW